MIEIIMLPTQKVLNTVLLTTLFVLIINLAKKLFFTEEKMQYKNLLKQS